jgi:hypothetical protein
VVRGNVSFQAIGVPNVIVYCLVLPSFQSRVFDPPKYDDMASFFHEHIGAGILGKVSILGESFSASPIASVVEGLSLAGWQDGRALIVWISNLTIRMMLDDVLVGIKSDQCFTHGDSYCRRNSNIEETNSGKYSINVGEILGSGCRAYMRYRKHVWAVGILHLRELSINGAQLAARIGDILPSQEGDCDSGKSGYRALIGIKESDKSSDEPPECFERPQYILAVFYGFFSRLIGADAISVGFYSFLVNHETVY